MVSTRGRPGQRSRSLNLGVMYFEGQGAPRDYVAAYMWLTLAAAQEAGATRDSALAGLAVVAQRLSADQIADGERRAQSWRPAPQQ